MANFEETSHELNESNVIKMNLLGSLNICDSFEGKTEFSSREVKVCGDEKCSETTDSNKIRTNRPILDSSLPYIPVYTHLITYDLLPIERPPTPPVIKMIKSELRATSSMRSTPESKKSSKLGKNL